MKEIDVDPREHTNGLKEIARKVVYPAIRRAVLSIDIANYSGHIYISPEVIINSSSTWIGRSGGRPQADPYEDIINLVGTVFTNCKDDIFLRRFERALVKWGESQEEPKDSLRTAEFWSALDALLHERGEKVKPTIIRRCIILAKREGMESIKLFIEMGWGTLESSEKEEELRKFLDKAYEIRNAVYHDAEDPDIEIGFNFKLNYLVQTVILKMAELANCGYSWNEIIDDLDKKAQQLGIN